MPILVDLPGRRRGRASLYSAAEAQHWRRRRGLTVLELSILLGWPYSTTSKKLNGRLLLTLDFDRQIEKLDQVVNSGQIPPGAPIWLALNVIAGRGWGEPLPRRRRSR